MKGTCFAVYVGPIFDVYAHTHAQLRKQKKVCVGA